LILVLNTAFLELDQLAVGLAEAGLLSRYLRPYANFGRAWERSLARLPGAKRLYSHTLGRRKLPRELERASVQEVALTQDFGLAVVERFLPARPWAQRVRGAFVRARMRAVARAGERAISDQKVVVASWGCAEPSFRKMREKPGGLCVLDFPTAHPKFYRKVLEEESQREPAFADTLLRHEWPDWLEERYEREIHMAHRILVGSAFARHSFTSEGVLAEKVDVIPYGADLEEFCPGDALVGERNGVFRALFVGRLDQGKGIAYLLRGYDLFKGAKTELTLVGKMAGSGAGFRPYRNLFRHFDHVPRHQVAEFYRQADVFVLPTLFEGMSLAVLEAMASGLPVITTPNGPAEVVRDGVDGFIVPIRDVDAIADRLDRLRADPELRMYMGRNARMRAREFTWSRYREAATATIHNLLVGKGIGDSSSVLGAAV
jgi:glycosyltransferase involved in cell wall biosynthesis